ncbi:MAG TPA: 2-phosphosulfolactate phosphatase [Candidatus Hydrogenedentes bacterium]|nr:2-phosphosulfolactate phosphatase [Candidatus Hydrogenedentota bacterium]
MPRVPVDIVTGAEGTALAAKTGAAAVVIDALRASATATMLLESGALEILITREVAQAFALRERFPETLLFGERGGLPPEGFDGGNSPLDTGKARGRRIVFTTTTGAGRVIACRGASIILMGTPLHASALCETLANWAARETIPARRVVLIPAGLMDDPCFSAQEDEVAALYLGRSLTRSRPDLFEPADTVAAMESRYGPDLDAPDGLVRLFESAPHAEKLRRVGLGHEVAWCAQVDIARAVPGVWHWLNNETPVLRAGLPSPVSG